MAATTIMEEVLDNYKKILEVAFSDENSPYSVVKKDIQGMFQDFGLTNQEQSMIAAQTISQLAIQLNSEALTTARGLLVTKEDISLRQAQAALVVRQTRGYDDNVLVKVMEAKGGIVQYAVNAGSDSLQDTITSFNEAVNNLGTRVCTEGCDAQAE